MSLLIHPIRVYVFNHSRPRLPDLPPLLAKVHRRHSLTTKMPTSPRCLLSDPGQTADPRDGLCVAAVADGAVPEHGLS